MYNQKQNMIALLFNIQTQDKWWMKQSTGEGDEEFIKRVHNCFDDEMWQIVEIIGRSQQA
jgi:hypothetical protein